MQAPAHGVAKSRTRLSHFTSLLPLLGPVIVLLLITHMSAYLAALGNPQDRSGSFSSVGL